MTNKTLASMLAAAIRNPKFLKLAVEYDKCRVQATAIGLGDKFDLLVEYEARRARGQPAPALSPTEILQLLIEMP